MSQCLFNATDYSVKKKPTKKHKTPKNPKTKRKNLHTPENKKTPLQQPQETGNKCIVLIY